MSNLERIQKERLIALANLPEGAFLESFLSESIRIAYEAGYMQGNETDVVYHRGSYKKGYRSGIERARELMSTERELPMISAEIYPGQRDCNRGFNDFRFDALHALNDELKKL